MYAIEREGTCWEKHCQDSGDVHQCGQGRRQSFKCLNESCPHTKPDDIENATGFDFGIFTDVLKNGLVLHTADFKVKLSYCFWWAFRNLR